MSDVLAGILAGVGGGLRGASAGYSWQKDYEQKERAISSREEIARLREEIRLMIEQAKEGGRTDRHVTPSGDAIVGADSRRDVATITQEGATARHNTPSGSVIANNTAAADRLTQNITFGRELETGRNRRHDTASGTARLGAETQRYGIDTRSADSRYATDTGATTTRRGQDIRSGDSRYAADKRNAMFQGIFGPTPVFNGRTPVTPAGGGGSPPIPDRERPEDPAAAAAAPPPLNGRTPITAKPPVTPPASSAPPSPKPADAAADQEARRRTRFEQIKREIAERQRKGQDISDLVRELQQLRTRGGGR